MSKNKKVRPIESLPILTSRNRKAYPKWHSYYEKVYQNQVIEDVDLNAFNWFYWFSPLGPIDVVELRTNKKFVAANMPFAFLKKGLGFAERQFANIGFFVKRTTDPTLFLDEYLEVLRSDVSIIDEKGVAWFFHTIGSGFQLKCREPRRVVLDRNEFPIDEANPFPAMDLQNVETLIYTETPWYQKTGLAEIVFRLDHIHLSANDVELPLFRGSALRKSPYRNWYGVDTHCLKL